MKNILLGLSLIASTSVFAADIELINCKGVKSGYGDFVTNIYLNVNKLKVDGKDATMKSYDMTIVNTDAAYEGLIPSVSAGSFANKNLVNEAYKGTKYKDHLKFHLTGKGAQSLGEQSLEYAALIINPAYNVEKTIHEGNNWDKTWTWDIEIRKHSAVLSLNFDDHHGDYIKLDCFSTGKVNEKRGKN